MLMSRRARPLAPQRREAERSECQLDQRLRNAHRDGDDRRGGADRGAQRDQEQPLTHPQAARRKQREVADRHRQSRYRDEQRNLRDADVNDGARHKPQAQT